MEKPCSTTSIPFEEYDSSIPQVSCEFNAVYFVVTLIRTDILSGKNLDLYTITSESLSSDGKSCVVNDGTTFDQSKLKPLSATSSLPSTT